MVLFETLHFSFAYLEFFFVYFRNSFRNFLLLQDANRVASSDCIYYVSISV